MDEQIPELNISLDEFAPSAEPTAPQAAPPPQVDLRDELFAPPPQLDPERESLIGDIAASKTLEERTAELTKARRLDEGVFGEFGATHNPGEIADILGQRESAAKDRAASAPSFLNTLDAAARRVTTQINPIATMIDTLAAMRSGAAIPKIGDVQTMAEAARDRSVKKEMEGIAAARATPERGVTRLDAAGTTRAALDAGISTVAEMPTKIVEYVGIGASIAGWATGVTPTIEDNSIQATARYAQAWAKRMFPGDAAAQEDLAVKFAQGLGSTAGFWGVNSAALALRIGTPGSAALVATIGGMVNAPDTFHDAQKSRKEGRKVSDLALAMTFAGGTVIGMIEAAPIVFSMPFLKNGRSPAAAFANVMLREGVEEAGQEFGQAVAQDLLAQWLHDPDRVIGDEAMQNALIGFLSGGAVTGGRLATSQRARQGAIQGQEIGPARAPAIVPDGAAAPFRQPNPKTLEIDLDQYGSGTEGAYPEAVPVPQFQTELAGSAQPLNPGAAPLTTAPPIPSFQEMTEWLPTDENGDPDLSVFQDAAEQITGKRFWNQLSDPEKGLVVQTLATGEDPGQVVQVVNPPAGEPQVGAAQAVDIARAGVTAGVTAPAGAQAGGIAPDALKSAARASGLKPTDIEQALPTIEAYTSARGMTTAIAGDQITLTDRNGKTFTAPMAEAVGQMAQAQGNDALVDQMLSAQGLDTRPDQQVAADVAGASPAPVIDPAVQEAQTLHEIGTPAAEWPTPALIAGQKAGLVRIDADGVPRLTPAPEVEVEPATTPEETEAIAADALGPIRPGRLGTRVADGDPVAMRRLVDRLNTLSDAEIEATYGKVARLHRASNRPQLIAKAVQGILARDLRRREDAELSNSARDLIEQTVEDALSGRTITETVTKVATDEAIVAVVDEVNRVAKHLDRDAIEIVRNAAAPALEQIPANIADAIPGVDGEIDTPAEIAAALFAARETMTRLAGREGVRAPERTIEQIVADAGPANAAAAAATAAEETAYLDQAIRNLKSTSRTAAGVVDTSASAGKAEKMAEGLTAEGAATAAVRNFESVIRRLYRERDTLPLEPDTLAAYVDQVAIDVNEGILRPGALWRTDDSPKYPYTAAEKIPMARLQFATDLAERLADPTTDPIETAAWIEWRVNLTDHAYADGVGKTSKALAYIPLMRAGYPLPEYRSNKEFFANGNKTRRDPALGGDSYLDGEWQTFLGYYRSLMPARDAAAREAAMRRIMETDAWVQATVPDAAKDTQSQPGFWGVEWKESRTYTTPTGEVVGYESAIQHLIDTAVAKIPGGQKFERRVFVLLGLPGAGKSTIAEKIRERHGAAHMVGDDAKTIIPEYDGGRNSGGVHEESSAMMKDAIGRMLADGGNIIVEKLGSSHGSIERLVSEFSLSGFVVDIIQVDVPKPLAMERAVSRWRQTGRAVPLSEFDVAALNLPGLMPILEADRRVHETAKIRFDETASGWFIESAGVGLEGLWPRAGAQALQSGMVRVDGDPVAAGGNLGSQAEEGLTPEGPAQPAPFAIGASPESLVDSLIAVHGKPVSETARKMAVALEKIGSDAGLFHDLKTKLLEGKAAKIADLNAVAYIYAKKDKAARSKKDAIHAIEAEFIRRSETEADAAILSGDVGILTRDGEQRASDRRSGERDQRVREGARALSDGGLPDGLRPDAEGRDAGGSPAGDRGGSGDRVRPDRGADASGPQSAGVEPGEGGRTGVGAADGQRDGDVGDHSRPAAVEAAAKADAARAARRRSNYRITDADEIGAGGPKAKVRANLEAIRIVRMLEEENRPATPDEKKALVKYVGWGAFAQDVFQDRKPEWAKERQQLRDLLTADEYQAAQASVLNAHYTSKDVIDGMWQAVEHLGFSGGRVIEPAAGIGHFIGLAPDKLADKIDWTAVELDRITGAIAKHLYEGSDVRVQGYETVNFPDNFFDLAISNVPFGNFNIEDRDRKGFLIHDYFFVKSMAKVRPGGLVAFITSAGTLDKQNDRARRAMLREGDLVGAIRLPGGNQGAFKANAGTDVTTDIIFLRKRIPGEMPRADTANWIGTTEIKTPEGPTRVNQYFAASPDMMLGKMRLAGSMYRKDEPVLIGPTNDMAGRIAKAAESMPADVMTDRVQPTRDIGAEPDLSVAGTKEGALFLRGGKLFQNVLGEAVPQKAAGKTLKRMRGLLDLRDVYNDILTTQMRTDKDALPHLRDKLNKAYDAFVSSFGPINKTIVPSQIRKNKDGTDKEIITRRYPNLAGFEGDPDYFKVGALESYDEETGKAAKSAVFTQDVIAAYERPTIAGPADAMAVSLNETGGIDMVRIAEMLKVSEPEAADVLGDRVYLNPNGGAWLTSELYLSGDVVAKLEEARAAAETDARYQRNVTALEAVQPVPLTRVDIRTTFGSPWIPAEVVNEFVAKVIGIRGASLKFEPISSMWIYESKNRPYAGPAAQDAYGTPRVNVTDLVLDALNNKTVKVFDTIKDENGSESKVINRQATEDAEAKVRLIQETFAGDPNAGLPGWVWEDDARAVQLEAIYNRTFNRLVPTRYDGSHLDLPGLAKSLTLPSGKIVPLNRSPHRVNAIWRAIVSGNMLMDHAVGSGKTITAIAAVMEMKRLGQIQRPMFVVPNHMLEQFGREFLQAYPNAKILVADKKNMEAKNRKAFAARIAADKWDGIIITHSAFGRMPMQDQAYIDFLQSELTEIVEAWQEAKKSSGEREDGRPSRDPTVKQIERKKKQVETQIAKLVDKESKDDGVTFEELGIDFVVYDESHYAKNLTYNTRHANVKGLGVKGSQRATDLFIKIRHLEKSRPGRSTIFMTGTPMSRSMAEIYTIQRYLQLDMLREYGVERFDAWAATFGRIVSKTEQGINMKLKDVASFSKFINVPELQAIYSRVADSMTAEQLNLPRPALKGGAPQVVISEMSSAEVAETESLIKQMEDLKGPAEKGQDNHLSLFTKTLQVATDMRLLYPNAPFNPTGKIAKVVENVARIYKDGKAPALGQLIFLDMGVPGSKTVAKVKARPADIGATESEDQIDAVRAKLAGQVDEEVDEDAEAQAEVESLLAGKFNLYQDIKDRLVAQGVPAKEIAFIHDAKTDAAKATMFKAMREGKIRVMLGSSGKMGVGTNVQRYLTAMHHVDAPWNPADVVQRDGRILRQGNENKEVDIFRYVTELSADAYRWQILARKAEFEAQFRAGARGLREAEDIDSPIPEAATLRALATGDPRIMEHAELTKEIRELDAAKRGHERSYLNAQRSLADTKAKIAEMEKARVLYDQDGALVTDLKGDNFAVRLDLPGLSGTVKERKKAGEAIRAQMLKELQGHWGRSRVEMEFGAMSGFRMVATGARTDAGFVVNIGLSGAADYVALGGAKIITADSDPVGLVRAFENVLIGIPGLHKNLANRIEDSKRQIERLEKQAVATPFPRAIRLATAKARHEELEAALKGAAQQPAQEATPEVVEEMAAFAPDRLRQAGTTLLARVRAIQSPSALDDGTPFVGEKEARYQEDMRIARLRQTLIEELRNGEVGTAGDRIGSDLEGGSLAEGEPGTQEADEGGGRRDAIGALLASPTRRARALEAFLSPELRQAEIDARADAQGFTTKGYHGTRVTSAFDPNPFVNGRDFGFHVGMGSPAAANSRLGYPSTLLEKMDGFFKSVLGVKESEVPKDQGNILPVRLRVKNALRLPDIGVISGTMANPWADPIAMAALLGHPESQAPESLKRWVKTWVAGNGAQTDGRRRLMRDNHIFSRAFAEELDRLGYDAIVYKNLSEGIGRDSLFVWNPANVRSAFDFFHDDAAGAEGLRASDAYVDQDLAARLAALMDDEGMGEATATQFDDLAALRPEPFRDAPTTPGLDMSREERLARAEAMGFDTGRVWYHGTRTTFDSFDPSKAVNQNERAVFLTQNKNIAAAYAGYFKDLWPDGYQDMSDRVGSIMPLYVRGRIKDVDFKGDKYGRAEELRQARADGYDGVMMRNHMDVGGVQDQLAVFDPSNIRSVNAAFDPANAGSANLMAAFPSGTLTPTPEARQSYPEIAKAVESRLRTMLPPDVAVRLSHRLFAQNGQEQVGRFRPDTRVVSLALAYGPDRAIQVGAHEVVHVLRDAFTDAEWASLVERARKVGIATSMDADGLIVKYRGFYAAQARGLGLSPEMVERFVARRVEEELVARLAEQYFAPSKTRFGTAIDALLKRLADILDAVVVAFTGRNLNDPALVFRRMERGEVAKRVEPQRVVPQQFQLTRTERDDAAAVAALWGESVALPVNPDGSLTLYRGENTNGESAGGRFRGRFFTTDRAEARAYAGEGGSVRSITVPKDRVADLLPRRDMDGHVQPGETYFVVPSDLGTAPSIDAATAGRAAREAQARLKAGLDFYPPVENIRATFEALAPIREAFPASTKTLVISRVEATDRPGMGTFVFVDEAGAETSVRLPLRVGLNLRAAYLRSLDVILFARLNASGDLRQLVPSEAYHEIVHAKRRLGLIPAADFDRLVAHANALGVIDQDQQSYLMMLGDEAAFDTAPGVTIRETYQEIYSSASDINEILSQESVAHFVEMVYHGAVRDEQLASVRDILAAHFPGLLAMQPVEMAAFSADTDTGRSMRRDLDQLGYFSAALEAAKSWPMAKGTPEQVIAHLKKSGVKDAEIEAVGLKAWLDAKGPRPEPGAGNPEAEATGRDVIAEIASGKVPYEPTQFKPEFDNLDGISLSLTDDIERALRSAGIDARLTGASAQSVSKYLTVNDGDRSFKLRVSDHPDRHGSDYTVRIDSASREVYSNIITGERISEMEYSDLGRDAREDYDWRGHAIDRSDYVEAVRDGLGAVAKFLADGKPKEVVLPSLTRDDLVAFLEGNSVGLREVVRQDDGGYTKARILALEEEMARLESRGKDSGTEYESMYQEWLGLTNTWNGTDRRPRWSAHSLDPSNPTYRETVLHLPSNNEIASQRVQQAEDEFGDIGDALGMMPEDVATERGRITGDFQSGHFSEPNIIGHMMTSMVKHEGRPVYLIDQIQSDWGQRLRDGGVRDEAKIASLQKQLDETIAARDEIDAASTGADGLYRPDAPTEELARLGADIARVNAELRTAEAATPGNPMVNTTDQWTTTTLRRAIRQAAEADAAYIAIPSGDTVLSYNPGDRHGMNEFYGKIVPKNLRNILQKLDKSSPPPQMIKEVETPSGMRSFKDPESTIVGSPNYGFTLFPLTDAIKAKVRDEGQAMFALAPSSSPLPPPSVRPFRMADYDAKVTTSYKEDGLRTRIYEVQGADKALVRAALTEREPEVWEVIGLRLDRSQHGKGLATELLAAIEADTGRALSNAGIVTADVYQTTLATKPERVRFHVPAGKEMDGLYVPPSALEMMRAAATRAGDRVVDEDTTPAREREAMKALESRVLDDHYLLRRIDEDMDATIAADERAALKPGSGQPQPRHLPKLGDTSKSDLVEPSVGLSDLVDMVNDALDMETRQGRLNPGLKAQMGRLGAKLYGQFSRRTGIARLAIPNDLGTLVHEGGHRLEIHPELGPNVEAIKQSFSAELIPLASAGPEQLSEGWAEWFRAYMIDRASAQQSAPKTYQAFRKMLEQRSKELLLAFDTINAGYESIQASSPGGVVLSRTKSAAEPMTARARRMEEVREKGWKGAMSDWWYAIIKGGANEKHPIKVAVNLLMEEATRNLGTALKKGEKVFLKAVNDPYKIARMAEHARVHATAVLRNGVVLKGRTLPSGPSMRDVLNEAFGGQGSDQWHDGAAQKFGAYLIARRMNAEWDRFDMGELEGPPDHLMSRQAWGKAQTDFEAANPSFKRAARILDRFMANVLEWKYQNGFLTEDLYMDLKSRQGYAPLNRIMDDRGATASLSAKGPNKRALGFKFKGSTRDFINPLESILADVYTTESRIELNNVIRALDKAARAAGPNGGKIAERLPSHDMKASKVNLESTMERLKKETERLVDKAVQAGAIEHWDASQLIDEIDTLFDQNAAETLFSATATGERGERIVYLWENGKRVPILLGSDQLGEDIWNIFAGMGKIVESEPWLNGAVFFTQAFRAGVTKSPMYVAVNWFRDQLATWALSRDFTPFWTGLKGLGDIVANTDAAKRYEHLAGMMGGIDANIIDTMGRGRDVLQLRKSGFFAAPSTFKTVLRSMEITEAASRIGHMEAAYQRLLSEGFSEEEAAFEAAYNAHDVMDFSRRGSKMIVASRLVAFLNSQLQGMSAALRTIKGERDDMVNIRDAITPYIKASEGIPLSIGERENYPISMRIYFKMATIGLIGLALKMLYKDDPEHEELSKGDMGITHWFTKINGVWWRLPKPFELAIFSNLFETMFDRIVKDDPTAAQRFAKSVRETMMLSPEMQAASGLVALAHMGKDGLDAVTGKSQYDRRKSDLPQRLQGLPPEMQFDAYTSELGKLVGRMTGKSPYLFDNVVKSLFASVGRHALSASDALLPWINRNAGGILPGVSMQRADKSFEDQIFLSRITRRSARGANSTFNFWQEMSQDGGRYTQAAKGYHEALAKWKSPRDAERILGELNEDHKAFALLEHHYKEQDQDLHPLNRARQVISAINGIRRQMVLDTLYVEKTNRRGRGSNAERIVIAPSTQRVVNEVLEDIAMREARNAQIVIGKPGWKNAAEMRTEGLWKELHAAAPQVAEELHWRLTHGPTKVYAYDAIKQVWPDVRRHLLTEDRGSSLAAYRSQARIETPRFLEIQP